MPAPGATAETSADGAPTSSEEKAAALLAIFAPYGDGHAAWISCSEAQPTFDRYRADDLVLGWKLPAPAPDLARAFAAQTTLPSVGSSKALRRTLEAFGVKFAKRTFAERMGSASRPFLFVSIPVLSEDGRQALAYVSTGFGEGMGMGMLILAQRRDDGVWASVDRRMVWMS